MKSCRDTAATTTTTYTTWRCVAEGTLVYLQFSCTQELLTAVNYTTQLPVVYFVKALGSFSILYINTPLKVVDGATRYLDSHHPSLSQLLKGHLPYLWSYHMDLCIMLKLEWWYLNSIHIEGGFITMYIPCVDLILIQKTCICTVEGILEKKLPPWLNCLQSSWNKPTLEVGHVHSDSGN